MRKFATVAILAGTIAARDARAQAVDPATPPSAPAYETVVTATTPLHGSGLPLDHVPANVQTITSEDLAEHRSLDLAGYMGEALGSVHINDVQGNPLQPDLQYRGFLASPLLGAPQGLSMYLDGVRLNEPFGDTINWDLIPTNAIRSVNLIPGSNPVFGLNTLGGALSLESKDGFSDPGLDASLLYGSWNRALLRANGGAHNDRFGIFAAAEVFDETGWREDSPSSAARAFLAGSYRDGPTKVDLTLAAANTSLTGNGVSPIQQLALDRAAVFTTPDSTENQLFMATLRADRALASHVHLAGTAYLRTNRTKTSNGDQHDWSQCTDMAGVLCASDDGSAPPVLDSSGNPVAFKDGYDAAYNRTFTRQTSYGLTAQLAVDAPIADHENHLFVGADADQSRVRFRSSTTVGELDDNRNTIDDGFLDPTSPISVDSVANDLGVYATDTFSIRRDLHFVASGRFNYTSLSLDDLLGGGLTGDHSYSHVNPAVGLSYQPKREIGLYASFSQSNRAPTAIELTCATPTDPCRLPNAFVSDPSLAQVVARTVEAGARGRWRRGALLLTYDLTGFRTTNSNDILFVSSGQVANQGYFANVGETRRQGVEADLAGRQRLGGRSRLEWSLHYTLTDARFESPFTELSATHPNADANHMLHVQPGARIPSIPEHVAKAGLTYVAPFGLSAGANVVANSGQYYRGDEVNQLPQIPGYVVVNARLAYQIWTPLTVFALVDNVFDAQYSTFGVLGDPTDVFPTYTDKRFVGPGAPRAFWGGVDLHY
jgi:iron complex outermembrane receptor protein